jgi:hypothetical protein
LFKQVSIQPITNQQLIEYKPACNQLIETHQNTNQIIETQHIQQQNIQQQNVQQNQVIETQQNIQQNIQQTNNQNIIINVLGMENKSYITDEFMADCIKQQIDGLCNYNKKVHFDPEHPENHNIQFVDNHHYRILEDPVLSKQAISSVEYMSNILMVQKKDTVLKDHILTRFESHVKDFLQNYTKLTKQHINKFVKFVLFPLNLSANLDEEDELEYVEDEEIERQIMNILKSTIDKCLNENA